MPSRFRVMDLMVAVFVAAVGLGLLLPASNRSNYSSRDGQCQNNVRQVALALLQYQTTFGRFPASHRPGPGPTPGPSHVVPLFAYMDQQALADTYNVSLPPWDAANEQVASARISVLRCPSGFEGDPVPARQVVTPDGRGLPGNTMFGVGHYGVNWGGGRYGFGSDFLALRGRDRGVMGEGWGARPDEIRDGASTTVLLGEKPSAAPWLLGGWAASEFDVGPCPGYFGNDRRAKKVLTGSGHGQKVIVCFADGSVRWINPWMSRPVWYAHITRDGGEVVDPKTAE